MNVLIATPTYADALRPETASAVKRMGAEWRVYDHNPYPAPDSRNVGAAYQHIRREFLAGSWDALLAVEHDMIPPADALAKLWETGAPVAYGVYLLRHGSLVLNACEYVGDRNMGESLSLHPNRYDGRGVLEVSGVGFGCTLFRREVIERIPFEAGGVAPSPDVPFAQACVRAGVRQVARFDVLCGHWERGRILMPFQDDTQATRRVRMAVSINALVGGASRALVQGQEYELPATDAIQLRRAGYAEAIDDAPGDRDAVLQTAQDARPQRRKPVRAK